MRTALVYNFLIESTIIASIGIVLMMLARRLLRKPLGSRALLLGWALVAVRLLCPLVLPNPLINRIRSPFAADAAIRPIAGQVKVRLQDLFHDVKWFLNRRNLPFAGVFHHLREGMYSGMLARRVFILWLIGLVGVITWFAVRWVRKKGDWKREILPALCCAVHWFNPLVWIAWRMMRADALLAKAQPKGRRPFGVVFAAAACALLVCAFATGEFFPALDAEVLLPPALPAFPMEPDDEALIAYAQALYALPGFSADATDAQWQVSRHAAGYTIHMERGELFSCTLNLLPDGRVIRYYCRDLNREENGRMGFERRASDDFSDRLSGCALALMDRLIPGVSDWIEAFEPGRRQDLYPSGYEGAISGITYIHQNTAMPGMYLRMQVEPEMRIREFSVDSAIVQTLWEKGLEPLSTDTAQRLGVFPVREMPESVPNGLLAPEEALEKVIAHIKANYGETDASLRRFELRCSLNTEGEPAHWTFNLDSLYLDSYAIDVNAATGDILQCFGPNEGNG